MSRPIAFNIVRGLLGALHKTPRGIDRIDFGYAAHLFQNWPGDCVGVMPTPFGMRYYSREAILRGHALLGRFWNEGKESPDDTALDALKAVLAGSPAEQPIVASRFNIGGYWRIARLLLADGIHWGRPVSSLPEQTLYMDIGHVGLGTPRFLDWLDHRPDISPIFMLHDAIPLELPGMVDDRTRLRHQTVLAMTARHARAVIVPTNAAGRSIKTELDRLGSRDIAIHPVSLPIEDVFLAGTEPDPVLTDRPYFLICGAIEPRKNHALLIEAWAELAARLRDRTPRLIIAGARDYRATEILGLIETRGLKGHVFVASGLSTRSIARLMAGARAVLMPSFAEGFGLPPVEALSLGKPAILSDIEAHHDAVGDFGIYLGTSDAGAWAARIEAMVDDTPDYLAWKAYIAGFRPYDWSRYMAEISGILNTVD